MPDAAPELDDCASSGETNSISFPFRFQVILRKAKDYQWKTGGANKKRPDPPVVLPRV
jgi:hypothetical protein